MNCSFCGKELKEDAKFCLYCGTRVQPDGARASLSHQPTKVSAKSSVHSSSIDVTEKAEKKGKVKKERKQLSKKKLIISLVAAAMAVVILCGVGVFALLSAKESVYNAVSAYISTDGTAYICYGDGRYATISGDIKDAYLTADRERIVAVDNQGNVFWLKAGKDKKNMIARGADGQTVRIVGVCNDMFFFTAESENSAGNKINQLYCHSFEEKSTQVVTDIAKCDGGIVASPSLSSLSADMGTVAFATQGVIYVFDTEKMNSVAIGTYGEGEQIALRNVSADGEAVLWLSVATNVVTPHVWIDGNTLTLDPISSGESAPNYYMSCPADSSDVVVISTNSNKLYIKSDESKSFTTVDMPSTLAGFGIYTANGERLSEAVEVDAEDGFFVPVVEKNGNNEFLSIIHVSASGSKSALATGIKYNSGAYAFSGNKLLYIDSSDNAHVAEIHKNKTHLSGNTQIVTGAVSVIGTKAGTGFVYVLTAGKSEGYDLCRYDTKNKNTASIASNVYERVLISEDGESIYYFTDVESSDTGVTYGTLNCYSDGKNSRVEKNVILSSVDSHLASGELNSEAIWFATYVQQNGEGYIFNTVFYDGKQAQVKIANATKD